MIIKFSNKIYYHIIYFIDVYIIYHEDKVCAYHKLLYIVKKIVIFNNLHILSNF